MCGAPASSPMAISKDGRLSSEREALKTEFLARAGLSAARRERMPGDASTRGYERLHLADGGSLIFMDQPPSAESRPCPPGATVEERRELGYNALARLAAGRVEAFIACAGYLQRRGLSAPRIFHAEPSAGLAVLEDLGDGLYARLLSDGAGEAELYDAAIDALVHLQAADPPGWLEADGVRWPLLDYDEAALQAAGEPFLEWLPRFDARVRYAADDAAEWDALWSPIRGRAAAGATVFCHRDYHAENLIWLPERTGPARVGLLDFQDALRAHPVWDLSMLLHDARRDVSAEREAAALDRYLAARPATDREAIVGDYNALGALNIVRILGVFARLVVRDGKPRYASFMPRMWGYLDRVLVHPDLAGIAAFIEARVPAEVRR